MYVNRSACGLLRTINIILVSLGLFIPISGCATEPSVASAYEKVNTSVVSIFAVGREMLFDAEGEQAGDYASPAVGSGVIVTNGNNIVTAAHLVQTADYVGVEFFDGSRMMATVIASDPFRDLALLEVESMPASIRSAPLGDSDEMRIGDRIFIIGTPYGLNQSLSGGFISGRHHLDDVSVEPIGVELFQTDAAVNQGNSGAPLFNLRGEVIGIASMIMSQSGGSEGLAFAITSNTAQQVLISGRPFWSGMNGTMVTGDIAASLNVPQQSGYIVQRVAIGSPADRMDIRAGHLPIWIGDVEVFIGGDILLSIDGIEFDPSTMRQIQQHTASLEEGQAVTIQSLRKGVILTLVGTL